MCVKCTKFDFGWGAPPQTQLTTLPQTPSWIWGPLRGRGRGWAEKEEGKEEGGGSGGREREGPQVTVEPGPLRALLRQWIRAK